MQRFCFFGFQNGSSKEISMTNYFCFGDFDRKIFSDSGVDMNQFSLVGSSIGGI